MKCNDIVAKSLKLDCYLSLCTEYYDLIRPRPPEDAYAFYRDYIKEIKGSALEPMCGSGRFLLPLIKEGFEIHGFDASPQMLQALKTKAATEKLKPHVWEDFAENFKSATRYPLIFIPSGSFGHIIELDAVKLTLKRFYEQLCEGGMLLFETESSQCIPHPLGVWRGDVCLKADGKMIVVNRLFNVKDSICSSIDRYELIEKNQIIKTEIETFQVRLFDSPDFLLETLKEIGFKTVKMLKAFDRKQIAQENDASIVYECKK